MGEVARQHAKELVRIGHDVWYMHPVVGEGAQGAHNVDVELHTDVLPVHEYLPVAGRDQRAVSNMDAAEALAYVPDYEAALEEVADDIDVFIGHHANLAAIAVHRVATRHGKPYVLFLHGTGIEPRLHGGYAPEVWEQIEEAIDNADGVIVTTEYVRDVLVRPLVNVEVQAIRRVLRTIRERARWPSPVGNALRTSTPPPRLATGSPSGSSSPLLQW